MVVHLAGDSFAVDHRDPSEIAAALEADDQDTAMKLTDEWPYDE
jgi:hypothetical protein